MTMDKIVEASLVFIVMGAYYLKELMLLTPVFFDITALASIVILSTLLFRRIITPKHEAKLWREMNS